MCYTILGRELSSSITLQLLQCELLVGMTICRLDDPKYDTYATYDTLEMARSKFSKLVTGKSYYHLLSHHDYRLVSVYNSFYQPQTRQAISALYLNHIL